MMLIKQIWQPTWAAEEDVSVSGRSNLPYLLISAVTSKGQKRLLTPDPRVFTWPLLKFATGIWAKKASSHLALGWLQVSFSLFQMGCSSSVKPVWKHPHRTVCSKSCQVDKIIHATSIFPISLSNCDNQPSAQDERGVCKYHFIEPEFLVHKKVTHSGICPSLPLPWLASIPPLFLRLFLWDWKEFVKFLLMTFVICYLFSMVDVNFKWMSVGSWRGLLLWRQRKLSLSHCLAVFCIKTNHTLSF